MFLFLSTIVGIHVVMFSITQLLWVISQIIYRIQKFISGLSLAYHEITFRVILHKHGVLFKSSWKAISLCPALWVEYGVDKFDLIKYKGCTL